jgi:hypothetical protein
MNPLTLLGLGPAILLASCAARPEWDPRSLGDLMPPVLAYVRADGPCSVELRFDEPVQLVRETLITDPPCEVGQATSTDNSLRLATLQQQAGQEYRIEATVEDTKGNSSSLIARFWGFNAHVPRILINELTTRGTGTHPDLVELRVLTEGDLAGLTIYQGTPGDWIDRKVFPARPVAAGDYVLVHFRPEGIPEECDETGGRDVSGGLDATPEAVDLWVPDGQGLSGNNGALCLTSSPDGEILDAVLYSNRSAESDDAYGGFGSAPVQARAVELVRRQAWMAADAQVRPEDAVSPEGSTGTRSIARSRTSVDTNSPADWHITPTRGATWGRENTDERLAVRAR